MSARRLSLNELHTIKTRASNRKKSKYLLNRIEEKEQTKNQPKRKIFSSTINRLLTFVLFAYTHVATQK